MLKSPILKKLSRTAAALQGVFYLVTGVWPILHIHSFMAVTGPKVDLWLVKTVGALAAAIGLTLLGGARRKTPVWETGLLGMLSAAAFMLVDLIYVGIGQLSSVYLLDAAPEAVFVLFWLGALASGLD